MKFIEGLYHNCSDYKKKVFNYLKKILKSF